MYPDFRKETILKAVDGGVSTLKYIYFPNSPTLNADDI